MSLITGLTNQMIDTISSVTIDKYGDETSTTIYSNVPCRWSANSRLISTPEAVVEVVEITAWLLPEYTILYNYRFVKNNVTYKVSRVEPHYDLDGKLDHTKVVLI
jgi:hypothetical protein